MKRLQPYHGPLLSSDTISPVPSIKRSLLLCGLSVILCLSLLCGVTSAYFSDIITNQNNRIQTGNLKVGLEVSDRLTDGIDLDQSSPHYHDLKTADDGAIFSSQKSGFLLLQNWRRRLKNSGSTQSAASRRSPSISKSLIHCPTAPNR